MSWKKIPTPEIEHESKVNVEHIIVQRLIGEHYCTK